jgi:hypothetical protein
MSDLANLITECERRWPGCVWSIGKPADWVDALPPKVRKKKPYEAWVSHGDFGKKGFVCVPGDGATPEAALKVAMEKANVG